MKKSKGNRNHGAIYYIVFFTLLVALVTFAVLAICLGNLPLLFTAIGIALLFLAFTLAMRVYTKKRVAAVEKRLKEDGKALLESDIPRTVYLVYFGPLSRAKNGRRRIAQTPPLLRTQPRRGKRACQIAARLRRMQYRRRTVHLRKARIFTGRLLSGGDRIAHLYGFFRTQPDRCIRQIGRKAKIGTQREKER